MHELGLAESILDLVRQHVPDEAAAGVGAVRVRVGHLAGVIPESLAFCFGAIVAGTPYAGATLAIESVPASAELRVVDLEFDDVRGLAP